MKKILEIAKKHSKCPLCNEELYTVKQGEIWGEKLEILKKEIKENNLKVMTLGVCFGDERDGCYFCKKCDKEFDSNIELLEFINDCTIMPGGKILRCDCMKYEVLQEKYPNYKLEKISNCKTCKHYIKNK